MRGRRVGSSANVLVRSWRSRAGGLALLTASSRRVRVLCSHDHSASSLGLAVVQDAADRLLRRSATRSGHAGTRRTRRCGVAIEALGAVAPRGARAPVRTRSSTVCGLSVPFTRMRGSANGSSPLRAMPGLDGRRGREARGLDGGAHAGVVAPGGVAERVTGTPRRRRSSAREPATSRVERASSTVVRSGWVRVCAPTSQPAAIIALHLPGREPARAEVLALEVEDAGPAEPRAGRAWRACTGRGSRRRTSRRPACPAGPGPPRQARCTCSIVTPW